MSVLDSLSLALATVVAGAHAGLTHLGADPASALTWTLGIAAVVAVVRIALLPLTVHGVRVAHGRSRPGCLPLLLQVPVWFALYRLVSDVAAGSPVGAMGPDLVASLGAATILGVPLAERGYLGAGWTHLAVVAGLAGLAAALSFVTQRYLVAPNTVLADLPDAVARTHQLLPVFSAAGVLVAAAVVPVALLVYWVCNAVWTLGQSAVVWRWFATPGSPAAERASRR